MLFTTTCCAQCVDCPTVSHVLISFVCASADLLQQMICRAGRNGENACAEVLYLERNELDANSRILNFYIGEGCDRYRLQRLLDGDGLAASCKNRETCCPSCLDSFCDDQAAEEIRELEEEVSQLSYEDSQSPRKAATKRRFGQGNYSV